MADPTINVPLLGTVPHKASGGWSLPCEGVEPTLVMVMEIISRPGSHPSEESWNVFLKRSDDFRAAQLLCPYLLWAESKNGSNKVAVS